MTYNEFSGTLNPTQSITDGHTNNETDNGPITYGEPFLRDRLYKSSAVAEMGKRGHDRHGPKRGGLLCPFRGQLGLRLCNVAWAEVYFRTKWRLHPSSRLATLDMNGKLGAVPLLGGAATPPNTTPPEPTFTSVPGGILIHPAVWPRWPQ